MDRLIFSVTMIVALGFTSAPAYAGHSESLAHSLTSKAREVHETIRNQEKVEELIFEVRSLASYADSFIVAEFEEEQADVDFLINRLVNAETIAFAEHPQRAELIHTFRQHVYVSLEKQLTSFYDRIDSLNPEKLRQKFRSDVSAASFGLGVLSFIAGTVLSITAYNYRIDLLFDYGIELFNAKETIAIIIGQSVFVAHVSKRLLANRSLRRHYQIMPNAIARAQKIAQALPYDCNKSLLEARQPSQQKFLPDQTSNLTKPPVLGSE